MKKIYGVYTHATPDGTIFHVGKGPRGRSVSTINRNQTHRKITKVHGWENIIIRFYECSSEKAALLRERNMIKNYKEKGIVLTNRTSGGQGVSGLKHSRKSRRKMSDPKHFKSRSESSKRNMQNPATREKIRKTLTGRKQPRAVIRKIQNTLKRMYKDPIILAKHKKRMKKLWKNKEYREMMIAKSRAAHKTIEFHENMSAAQKKRYQKNKELRKLTGLRFKKLWNIKSYRDKTIAAQNKGRSTQEYKIKRTQITTNLWKDPKYRKKMSLAHANYHANKDKR